MALAAWALGAGGCASPTAAPTAPGYGQAGVNRRALVARLSEPAPDSPPPSPRGEASDPPGPRYRLNRHTIIRLVYEMSPLVRAAREQMIAAQHQLAEFRANLSRFEPFAEATADASRFPERRDSQAAAGQVVGGLEKETFDGAVLRLEGGMSGSRVELEEVDEDQDEVESGSGGVFRARVEVPFAGSRKRQDRIISQAFQESTARKAVLNYFISYRSYVGGALLYYQQALLYWNYAQAYQRKLERVRALLNEASVTAPDRMRLQSTAGDDHVLLQAYRDSYRNAVLTLLEYLAISPEDDYVVEDESDASSAYIERARTPEGRQEMLEDAYANNPTFQVLEEAVREAELRRAQAMAGTYDVTAFVEGTQFAFGSETFDDRVGGWQVTAGLTVRVNDQAVLNATRRKAEAQIREFQADIQVERLDVQEDIASESDRLRSHHQSRPEILRNIARLQEEFQTRRSLYLEGGAPPLTIDDVLVSLDGLLGADIRLAANLYYAAMAEDDLIAATGEVYRLVGVEVASSGK